MPYTKLGYNIHANAPYSEDIINAWWDGDQTWGSTGGLVMNNPGLVRNLQARGGLWVYRHWPDDDPKKMGGDPVAWVRERVWELGDRRIVVQLGNEWGTSQEHIDFLLRAARECVCLGQAYGVGAWGMGGPDDTNPAVVDRLIPLVQYLLDTGGYWLAHEYFFHYNPQYKGWIGGHYDPQTGQMVDQRYVNYDPLDLTPGADPADMTMYSNWFIGRYARHAYIFTVQRGLRVFPNVLILEHGPDETEDSDYKGWRINPRKPQGPMLTEAQYAAKLIWCQENVYDVRDPDNPYYGYSHLVKLVTPFCLGNSGRGPHLTEGNWFRFNMDWDATMGFYTEPAYELFEIIRQWASNRNPPESSPQDGNQENGNDMPEEQEIQWKQGYARATAGTVWIRNGPGTWHATIGQLTTTLIEVEYNPNFIRDHVTYTWVQIRKPKEGYFAYENVLNGYRLTAVEEIEPDPEPEPQPDPEPEPEPEPPPEQEPEIDERWAILENSLHEMGTRLDQMAYCLQLLTTHVASTSAFCTQVADAVREGELPPAS